MNSDFGIDLLDHAYYCVADGDGQTKRHAKQASMWVAIQGLPGSAGPPFYARLDQLLDQHEFDGDVERLCARFYADDGRPGLASGRYFRLLLIGYFEDLDAERAIAWRAADSFFRDHRQHKSSVRASGEKHRITTDDAGPSPTRNRLNRRMFFRILNRSAESPIKIALN